MKRELLVSKSAASNSNCTATTRIAGLKQVITTPAKQQARRGVKPVAGGAKPAATAKLVELRGGGESLDLFASLDGFLRAKVGLYTR